MKLDRKIILILLTSFLFCQDVKKEFKEGFADASSGYFFIPIAAIGIQYTDPVLFSGLVITSAFTHKTKQDIAVRVNNNHIQGYVKVYEKGRKIKNTRSAVTGLLLGIGIRAILESY